MAFKTLCFTGHRPDKLYGYDPKKNSKLLWILSNLVENLIRERQVETFITGMALGIDMWSARIVLKLKEKYPHIRLVCAIPCKNHYGKWNEDNKREWLDICNKADEVHFVSEEPFTPFCMQVRNEWMVNNSQLVLAVWDGTKGGTANCVNYADKKKMSIIRLNPKTLKVDEIVR